MHYRRLGHEHKHEIPILITHYGLARLHYSFKMSFGNILVGSIHLIARNIAISVFIVLLDMNYVEIN